MSPSTVKQPFRSAFIALIGRPNSGKSTLMNTVIGEEISIVTELPQTTRTLIRGIYTTDDMQLIFIDTPGVHHGKHKISRAMLQDARRAITENADLVCWVVDISRDYGAEDSMVADLIRSVGDLPLLIVFNKIDLSASPQDAIKKFHRVFKDFTAFPSVSLSAVNSSAKEVFLAAVNPFVGEGPRYFGTDEMTDSSMREIAAEYIRKQIITATDKEVPHAVFVEIESYREKNDRHEIAATIHVETAGQRGIVIGKEGKVIQRIKRSAAAELMKLTGVPVNISCHVKVSPHWRDDGAFLRFRGITV